MLDHPFWWLCLSFLAVECPKEITMTNVFRTQKRPSISFVSILLELAKLIFRPFIHLWRLFFLRLVLTRWGSLLSGCLFRVSLPIFSLHFFLNFWLRKGWRLCWHHKRLNSSNQNILDEYIFWLEIVKICLKNDLLLRLIGWLDLILLLLLLIKRIRELGKLDQNGRSFIGRYDQEEQVFTHFDFSRVFEVAGFWGGVEVGVGDDPFKGHEGIKFIFGSFYDEEFYFWRSSLHNRYDIKIRIRPLYRFRLNKRYPSPLHPSLNRIQYNLSSRIQ